MTAQQRRISKREFIARVSAHSGWPIKTVSSIYEGIFSELTEAVSQGETVVLTRFGRFYRQAHKGHKVRFGKQDIDDYSVLKFSASPSVNRHLDGDDVDAELIMNDEFQNSNYPRDERRLVEV
ncbi:HU family DNA-binding protein [Psychromicrobium sp. YIM B11713]|uniref:HU family DNA-binding protein n=1 Tax=Psychromicrobium sp. YIM B11713 TaxID=3145233 RepID=UPI00374EB1A9